MDESERQPELGALLDEWNVKADGLARLRSLRRVLGGDRHRRNARRRALGRRAIGLLDFDRAALALGLSDDQLCGYAFGNRVTPDDMRHICAHLDRGDEQLVAGAVAAELGVGSALLGRLVRRFGPGRAREMPTPAETSDVPDRGAA